MRSQALQLHFHFPFRGKANPDGYGQRSDSRQKSPQPFLLVTRAVLESESEFRKNQLRFRTDPKKHSQAIWEARDSQSPGSPGIPTIDLGTTAVSPRECPPIGTVCGVGFLHDLKRAVRAKGRDPPREQQLSELVCGLGSCFVLPRTEIPGSPPRRPTN